MPDKEFDNLFRDKFKDAEIEPSANLWANIESELEPKKKRVFPIYWMAAASVAIAITAMLVFQKETTKPAGEESAKVKPTTEVKPITPVDTVAMPKERISIAEQPTENKIAKTTVNTPKALVKKEVAPVNNAIENNSQKNQVAMQPNQNNDRLPIKQQDPRPIDVPAIKDPVVIKETPIVTAYVPVKNEIEPTNTETSGRKGIRNVGDLVNYVVDKVDKRDKKLVRFNTDDDDNSSIIGINIGFLKFNKKNKDK